jgi:peptidoglycan/LPS O-acetylase OafA/YrhL
MKFRFLSSLANHFDSDLPQTSLLSPMPQRQRNRHGNSPHPDGTDPHETELNTREGRGGRSLHYRSDIDGLRAVAVLLVLLYHAGVPGFSGGYIGVDVFFVLTGFLITSILAAEMRAGTFRFQNFYLRRIKRLLPASITVLTATVVAGFVLLLPDDLTALLDSCRFAFASAANFYFWLNTGGYFDADIHELPLLHMWSLALEEQFYLLWPALLFLGNRFLSRRGLSITLAVAFGLGLAASHWGAIQYPNSAYFLLPGRAFEILLGAVVALECGRIPYGSRWIRTAASAIGLCLVVVPGFTLTSESTFPGINAFWPCLGTALLIITGAGPGTPSIVNRVLGVKPLVAIGLLSYSVYLWHWPIIAYLNYQGIEIEGMVRWVVMTAPIALAALTYALIERPFRYRFHYGFRTAFLCLVVAPVVIGFGAFSITRANDGFPARFPGQIDEFRRGEATASKGKCVYGPNLEMMPYCVLGVDGPQIDGLLVGDSYAGMYTDFMGVLASDAGLSFRHLWHRLSPPIPGVMAGKRLDETRLSYIEGRQRMLREYEFAVLISSWGGYGEHNTRNRLWNRAGKDVSADADRLQMALIADLVEQGVKVVLVDRPRATVGRARMKKIRAAKARGESMSALKAPVTPRGRDYFLNQVERKYPSVLIIRPFDVLCDNETCDVAIDETVMFLEDGSHLNHLASRLLGEKYLATFPNPLLPLR